MFQIVEAKRFPNKFFFKILLNPGAPDGSVKGEKDERRYREFDWGLDTSPPGPFRFARIRKEMKLIVIKEESKRADRGISLPQEIGNL